MLAMPLPYTRHHQAPATMFQYDFQMWKLLPADDFPCVEVELQCEVNKTYESRRGDGFSATIDRQTTDKHDAKLIDGLRSLALRNELLPALQGMLSSMESIYYVDPPLWDGFAIKISSLIDARLRKHSKEHAKLKFCVEIRVFVRYVRDEVEALAEAFRGLSLQTTSPARKRMPTAIVGDDDVCAVCLGKFARGAEIRRLSCFHCFHENCIARWFHRARTCPLCRVASTSHQLNFIS